MRSTDSKQGNPPSETKTKSSDKMNIAILKTEKLEIKRQRKLDRLSRKNNPANGPTPLLEIARGCLAAKGVVNHWTATYRRNSDGIFEFRNPQNPGVLPLP